MQMFSMQLGESQVYKKLLRGDMNDEYNLDGVIAKEVRR